MLKFLMALLTFCTHLALRPAHPTRPALPPPPTPTPTRIHQPWYHRGTIRLVGRSVGGLLIALTLIGFSVMPWPTTGAWSASVASDVTRLQRQIIQSYDLLLVSLAAFCGLLPLWRGLTRQSMLEARACIRIGYLLPLWGYWQLRRWRAYRSMQRGTP